MCVFVSVVLTVSGHPGVRCLVDLLGSLGLGEPAALDGLSAVGVRRLAVGGGAGDGEGGHGLVVQQTTLACGAEAVVAAGMRRQVGSREGQQHAPVWGQVATGATSQSQQHWQAGMLVGAGVDKTHR